MFNIFKKNEKTDSKLKGFADKTSELNAAELKKVNGGGNGGDTTGTGTGTDPGTGTVDARYRPGNNKTS